LHGSSGIHRTLNFSRHLSQFGWQPIVLTVTPGAHATLDPRGDARLPATAVVERALALDAARQLSIGGAYPKLIALPDRWISWWPSGVLKGLRLIRRHRPALLWSTYPIATAHLIALTLHRLTGLPWITDFRDPMVERDPLTGEEYPYDPTVRRVNAWIESAAVRRSVRAVFTTPGTARMYADRYPELPAQRWQVIENGFDEESFLAVGDSARAPANSSRPLKLLHSGILYPGHRDPTAFFDAVAQLRHRGAISASSLQIVLRASGFEDVYGAQIRERGISDIVSLEVSVPYEQALAEMLAADGLLIFQASNCNWQIPAKAYEYLRARRPILALTDPDGDTARLLRSDGVDTIAPIDSRELIAQAIADFLARIRAGNAPLPDATRVMRHARRNRTAELAALLDSVQATV
jgi:hypothetical protein